MVTLRLLTKERLRRSASGGERHVRREETVIVALSVSKSREGAIECNSYTKTAKRHDLRNRVNSVMNLTPRRRRTHLGSK